jgi:guanine deaminase
MAALLYRGMLLHAYSHSLVEWFADGGILVERGRILAVGEYETVSHDFPGVPVVDCRGSVIIPGLVDTHAHLAQLQAIGSERSNLLDWLDQVIFPIEEHCSNLEDAAKIADAFFRRALAAGTTTMAVYAPPFESATDVSFQIAEQLGIRVLMGMTLMDSNAPTSLLGTPDDLIAATERLAARWHRRGRLLYCITPRFAGSCSQELLERCGTLAAASGLPIQTHLAESPGELRLIAERFPHCHDYTSVYERAGLVTDRTILAHCIYLSSSELERIKSAAAAIAHCPASNAYLQSGIMPLVDYLDYGHLRIGLGTDIGAGYHASILDEARIAREHGKLRHIIGHAHRVPTATEAFYLATLGGADALGLQSEIGNFQPGKAADFVRIDLAPYRTINSADEALSYLLYAGASNVRETLIEGTTVWQRN